jgi:hypothetical protein
MRSVALVALTVVGLFASAASAGMWDPAYVWTNGYTQQYPGVQKFMNDWGLGVEGGSNWNVDPPTNQTQQWVADRNGIAHNAEADIMLSSGKIKWRTDNGVPAGGHARDYTGKLGVALGLMVSGNPSSGYPGVYMRGSTAGVGVGYTLTPTTYFGVSTNWKSTRSATVVDGITGNWTQPVDSWHYLKVVYNADAGKTWDAWLDSPDNHMWGHSTGDSGNYLQFGYLGTVNNQTTTYDYVAFGFGDANIGPSIPEPATLALLGAGGLSLMMRRRRV